MSRHNIIIGNAGENKAVDYLIKKGYIILERNFRTPYGEIDIIAQKDGLTIFCEVKTRSSAKYGLGREAITKSKLSHMLKSAEYYIYNLELDDDTPIRFDVIEITLNTNSLIHFEDILN